MDITGLQVPSGSDVTGWLETAICGELGSVGGSAPQGFDSYVRLFHPAVATDGSLTTWAEVATRTGGKVHPLMQWHTLVDRYTPSLWKGIAPEFGVLMEPVLSALCATLALHTTTADHCYFGFYTGQIAQVIELKGQERTRRVCSPADIRGVHTELHGRDYVIREGPLDSALSRAPFADESYVDFPPNMIWPADRLWFVATDIDLDSTMIAGGDELERNLSESKKLEVLPVGWSDLLTFDADRIN